MKMDDDDHPAKHPVASVSGMLAAFFSMTAFTESLLLSDHE